jgi:hypothetical protein
MLIFSSDNYLMNVLILTPDAVGSTLLQRMLTIYMQFHDFGRPVINLHELTNGLARYYSPEFNRELVSKHALESWGYHQSLQQVVEMLSSVDHYKTSRLAHYHLVRRGDSVAEQIPFYNYLNENFFIIACRRENVFEHAVSMTLTTVTKKLNVYDVYEKVDTFYDMYKSGINLDATVFERQLTAYKNYITWSEQYFNIGAYFHYEKDIPRLEQYILDLPVFSAQSNQITWDQNFGLSFNAWNQMHYIRSDPSSLSCVPAQAKERLLLAVPDPVADYQQHSLPEMPAVYSAADFATLPPDVVNTWACDVINRTGVVPFLDSENQQKLAPYQTGYALAKTTIDQMVKLGIMVSGPPIKKQTLNDKHKMIKNFDDLVKVYNCWVDKNPGFGSAIDSHSIQTQISSESNFWHSIINSKDSAPALPPIQQ